MASPLAIAVKFLDDFGFFDIILPFLLVFTLVFAILEKTKILGAVDNKAKKNLDAMVAFSVALFVVVASNIVSIIREAMPMISLVLVVLVSFMMLAGSFVGSQEYKITGWLKWFLTILVFIGVVLIFMGVVKTESGVSWLRYSWDYVLENWATGPLVSSLIFLAIVFVVIYYIIGFEKGPGKPETEEGKTT